MVTIECNLYEKSSPFAELMKYLVRFCGIYEISSQFCGIYEIYCPFFAELSTRTLRLGRVDMLRVDTFCNV